tara:strand:+ start:315 stop:926 length:612 start_codon:yes stop_codon:yes gene_type:complete
MIEAVAFDIGKVLLDFDYSILVKKMAGKSQWNEADLDAYLNQSPLLAEYESGFLSSSEFYKLVKKETGFAGSEADFAMLFEDIFTPISSMIDIHQKIAGSGIRTYTFSNTNEMAVRHISKNYDFWDNFSGHVLSHKVGALKPQSKIYEALEEISGLQGEKIAYVDDLPSNCNAGRDRGWQVCCHTDARSSCEFLKGLGLLSPS